MLRPYLACAPPRRTRLDSLLPPDRVANPGPARSKTRHHAHGVQPRAAVRRRGRGRDRRHRRAAARGRVCDCERRHPRARPVHRHRGRVPHLGVGWLARADRRADGRVRRYRVFHRAAARGGRARRRDPDGGGGPGPLLPGAVVRLVRLPVATIGTRFGVIDARLPLPALPAVTAQQLPGLMAPAFTIALLGAIESLLSAVVADGMIGGRHRSNMELVAQGVANIAAPLFGGIPATGAIARTATNVKNGGRTPGAGGGAAGTAL